MELGALICTARRPACDACPLRGDCAWLRAGRPASTEQRPAPQRYEGTDRQARGVLLALSREHSEGLPAAVLIAACPDREQGRRALSGLIADGLIVPTGHGRLGLPGLTVTG
jgi:A/G-specific adenine glycosylase